MPTSKPVSRPVMAPATSHGGPDRGTFPATSSRGKLLGLSFCDLVSEPTTPAVEPYWCGNYPSLSRGRSFSGAAEWDDFSPKAVLRAKKDPKKRRARKRLPPPHGGLPYRCQFAKPPLRTKLSATDFDGRVASGARKEGVDSTVDDYLAMAGGFGSFQKKLMCKLVVIYGILGADQILAAFLAPMLAKDWGLSLVQQQLLGSSWFAGGMIGFLCGGITADYHGRRTAIMYYGSLRAVCSLLLLASPSFPVMIMLRMLGSFGASGAFNSCFPMLAEHSPPESRAGAKLALGLSWTLAVVVLALWANFVQDQSWRWLAFFMVPGSILSLFCAFMLPESPQWLYAKGRKTDCAEALEKIAEENGNDIDVDMEDEEIDEFQTGFSRSRSYSEDSPREALDTLIGGQEGVLFKLILASTALSGCAYYGLCFAPAQSLGGNFYVAQIFSALVELPSMVLISSCADVFGRRRTQITFYYGMLVSLLILQLPSKAVGAFASSVAFTLARAFGNGLSTLKWVINAENIPTRSRGVGLAIAGILGQLGALIGPLLFTITPAPFLLLALCCGIAARCTWALPETMGKALP